MAFVDRLSLPPSLSLNFCGFYASAVGATGAAAAAVLCGQLRRLYHRGRRRPRRRRRRSRARVPRRPAVGGREVIVCVIETAYPHELESKVKVLCCTQLHCGTGSKSLSSGVAFVHITRRNPIFLAQKCRYTLQ